MIRELKEVIREVRHLPSTQRDRTSGNDEYLAAYCLRHHMTFRLPDKARFDPLIGLRVFVRLWKRLGGPPEGVVTQNPAAHALVIGGVLRGNDLITEYIERSSGQQVHSYIAKDFIPSGVSSRSGVLWALLPFAMQKIVLCLFSRDRANHAQMIAEVAEIAFILSFIRGHGIEQVFDFIPYEKDGNLITLLLRRERVPVTKIPSSGPLATHNKILIGDQLIVSTAYHYDELKEFSSTIRARKVEFWPPERAFTYLQNYVSRPGAAPNTIGYYSHGEWVRREEDHASHGLDVLGTEDAILRDLASFLKDHPDRELIIFAHPREKHPDWIARTRVHYDQYFKGLNARLADPGVRTPHAFHHVDIAVVSYTAIIFERLFCGYKIVIGNHGLPNFPLPQSSLNSICFNSGDRLRILLEEAYGLSDDEFYKQHGLIGYRYLDHPELRGIPAA